MRQLAGILGRVTAKPRDLSCGAINHIAVKRYTSQSKALQKDQPKRNETSISETHKVRRLRSPPKFNR